MLALPAPPLAPPNSGFNGDPAQLEDFKHDVRAWIELDNSIRRLQASIKERRAAKKHLSDRILGFMGRNNIEDLDTKDCRLRYKVSYVRSPLSMAAIKDRVTAYFSGDPSKERERQFTGAVFGNRERVEKQSLRRLPITPAP